MSDNITLTGLVGSEPRALTTAEGLAITSFRLASSQRRFDRAQDKWVDGETNWYTVTTFRQLAANAAVSIKKGERIVVTGRLKVRDWQSGDKRGINVDVEADALGHDLSWGTAAFSRGAGGSGADRVAGSPGYGPGFGASAGAGAPDGSANEFPEAFPTEYPSDSPTGSPTEAQLASSELETPF